MPDSQDTSAWICEGGERERRRDPGPGHVWELGYLRGSVVHLVRVDDFGKSRTVSYATWICWAKVGSSGQKNPSDV
jgi:hypothetical protein